MNLLPKTPAQQIAEQIDQSQAELIRHIESQLKAFHAKINTAGLQQEILDAFGNKAVEAVTKYSAMRDAVLAVNPSANIPAPDLKTFTPNANGTITYNAPPEPVADPE